MPSQTFTGNSVAELHEAEAAWHVALAERGEVALWHSRLFEGRTSPIYLTIDYEVGENKICPMQGMLGKHKHKTEAHP